ncbi:hypothetical protein GF420_11100 [candidate division GN15 bacterium]|nr:hypothetical protein [candidate division GN15 bacterium]
MAKRGLFAILAVIVLGSSATGWSNPTLDSLIERALTANPDIQALEYRHRAADYRAGAAGTLPDPQLTFSAMNLPKSSLSLGETPMSSYGIGVSQKIPWPGKLGAENDVAERETEIARLNVESSRDRIVRLVAEAYYDYAYWSLADGIINENLAITRALTEATETRYANGLGSAQDVLRVQTMASRLENRREEVQQMIRSALLRIGRLTDNPATADAQLAVELPSQRPPAFEPQERKINNPELLRAAAEISHRESRVDLARSSYWPDFHIGLEYKIRERIPMDPVDGEDFVSAMVGVSLPLWFFAKNDNQTRAAEQSVRAAESRERALRLDITQQIEDIDLQLERIGASLDRYDTAIVPQAQAAYDAAQVAYEVGKVDFNGLLAAQIDLFDIRLEELRLRRDYQHARVRLSELLGSIQER